MSNNATTLKKAILDNSHSESFNQAVKEWYVSDVYYNDEPEECACGKVPIHDVTIISNSITGANLTVGNVCINKLDSRWNHRIYSDIQLVAISAKSASKSTLKNLACFGLISEEAYSKLTRGAPNKRELSILQATIKLSLDRGKLKLSPRRDLEAEFLNEKTE